MSTKKSTASEAKKPIIEEKERREVKNISLDKLFVGELNERIDVGDLTGLSSSIKNVGVLEPLMVRPVGDKFEIICGRRRFEAAKIAGIAYAPCHVRDMNDVEALQASYNENEHRQSASPVEQGYQCYKLLERLRDIREVADILGKPTTWIKARIDAYEIHRVTSAVIVAKGPRGVVEGFAPSGIGLVDATSVHSVLRSRSVERYLSRLPEGKKSDQTRDMAKSLVEAMRTIDPVKKGKFLAEFRKEPSQDAKALAEKITREPRGLKISVYFPPEVGRFVEELSTEAGVSPSVWVRNKVQNWLKEEGHKIKPLEELVR